MDFSHSNNQITMSTPTIDFIAIYCRSHTEGTQNHMHFSKVIFTIYTFIFLQNVWKDGMV